MVLLEMIGNTSLSRGMQQMGALEWFPLSPAALAGILVQIFFNPWVLLGVGVLLGYFLFYLTALSRMDLSCVLPFTASSYILTSFMASGLLGEKIPATRWIGTLLISAGILFVNRSRREVAG